MRRILLRAVRVALFGTRLLSPLAALGQTSVDSSEHPNYLNHSYRFKVVVPAGVTYTRTLPPNPDHGIGMAVGDQTKLWVDASYTDSLSTVEEAKKQTEDCKIEQRRKTSLGGKPALLIRFLCRASDVEEAYEEELVLSVALIKHKAPVSYQIAVRATDGKISPSARDLFRKLLVGFSFLK